MRVRMVAVADGTNQSLLHATAAAIRRSARATLLESQTPARAYNAHEDQRCP